jgi:hypothetical protein
MIPMTSSETKRVKSICSEKAIRIVFLSGEISEIKR